MLLNLDSLLTLPTSPRRTSAAALPRLVSEPEVIQPRKVTLGGSSDSRAGFQFKYVWILAAFGLAVLLLIALILLAPEAPIRGPISLEQPQSPSPQSSRVAEVPTPLQMERQKRALAQANEFVKRFTELEIQLEDEWNVQAWGKQAFDEARNLANTAEAAFADESYEQAIEGYAKGVSSFEQLLSDAEAQYQRTLSEAIEALNRRDAESANQALDSASLYQPTSAMVEAGRRRLENLDEVIALLEQAAGAEAESKFDEAIRFAERARSIDPSTQGIGDYLRDLRASSLDVRFRDILAQGYAALDGQEFEDAESAFRKALGMKPGDPGAEQGLAQALTNRANRSIQSGLAQATEYGEGEDWEQAILAFDQVRQIDPSLSEANEGIAYARMRMELDKALVAMTGSPGELADDRQFAKAKALLVQSEQVSSAGPRLERQRETLAGQISVASQPAQLLLISDSETDVRLQYHGNLGRFNQKTLNVRPGRYLVQGGRDGYREVRFEFDVVPGAQSIEIICSESIN